MIPVTKPFIPPLKEYIHYLEGIWNRGYLTNNGPLVKELEASISQHLSSSPNLYMTNGTIALQLAIRALQLEGEIITTPYSYVATTSSILWERCTPVFVDCLPNGNMNADLIEAAITKSTSCIMATHVYGYPCEVEKIKQIADKHGLKVIYDAAHAFGVTYKGESLFNFGDISTTSYHATKLYHTVEGGAVFSNNKELLKELDLMRSFGHKGDVHYTLGINGKQSELHAAMGLLNLNKINGLIEERRLIFERYVNELQEKVEFIHHEFPASIKYNYAYFPVLLPKGVDTIEKVNKLADMGVGVRRYFYPSLNRLTYLDKQDLCPVSEDLAARVICLPMFNGLSEKEQETVITALKRVL